MITTHHVSPEENLKVTYLNKMGALVIDSSIFGRNIIDMQKIHYISNQKSRVEDSKLGIYRKLFILICTGSSSVEYSFEISDQEKAINIFREIEKYYMAHLKSERSGIQEIYDKFPIAK